MRYLLDTNVVSELRKRDADRMVVQCVAGQPSAELAISVITVMEIEIGVSRVERRDPVQGKALRSWFERRVLTGFRGRILPVDLAAARHAAALHVPDRKPERDGLIAATALSNDLTVVTRNIADFANTGVATINPWDT